MPAPGELASAPEKRERALRARSFGKFATPARAGGLRGGRPPGAGAGNRRISVVDRRPTSARERARAQDAPPGQRPPPALAGEQILVRLDSHHPNRLRPVHTLASSAGDVVSRGNLGAELLDAHAENLGARVFEAARGRGSGGHVMSAFADLVEKAQRQVVGNRVGSTDPKVTKAYDRLREARSRRAPGYLALGQRSQRCRSAPERRCPASVSAGEYMGDRIEYLLGTSLRLARHGLSTPRGTAPPPPAVPSAAAR
jgi:hypothetical protein